MRIRIALLMALGLAVLAACSPKTPTPIGPDLEATLMIISPFPETATPLPPVALPTPVVVTAVPTTPVQPTAAPPTAAPPAPTAATQPPQPTAPPAAAPLPSAGAERLSFQTGATSANLTGFLAGGTTRKLVLKALQGQVMMLNTDSAHNNIFLGVTGLGDGKKLVSVDQQWTHWWGTLPTTQDYLIQLYAGGGNTDYNFQVIIPQRIKFDAGATSAKVSGTVSAKGVNTYLVSAAQGQNFTATLTSPNKDVVLTVYGLEDGEPLVRSAVGVTTWTGKLPKTQDYVVEAVSVGGATSYTLEIDIP